LNYKIAFKKSVRRDLKRIGKDQADRILKKIEEELPEKADSYPSLTGKFAGLKKYRVGDYRIIYSLRLYMDSRLVYQYPHIAFVVS